MIESAIELIKKHEGTGPVRAGRFYPYECTAKKMTIGFGRNIEDIGISEDEAEFMLRNDILRCIEYLKRFFSEFDSFSEARRVALIDMVYNLGPSRFGRFEKMISAIHSRDWAEAGKQATDSVWFNQVGNRSATIVSMLTRG